MLEKVICGDSQEELKKFEDNSFDLTVTSPPYDNLRNYNNSLIWNFDIFKNIANQLFRVTKEGGAVVWIVGDATIKGSETGTSFRQALYFKEVGFNLHDTMIYHKKSVGACGSKNCYNQAFEYMLIFVKNKIKVFNIIKDLIPNLAGKPCNYTKHSKSNKSGYSSEYVIKIAPMSSKRQNVWHYNINFGGGDNKGRHPAVFPLQLAKDHVISWSNENDTILDPFAGSGTVGVACKELKRNFVLIEKEPQYIEIINQRLQKL